jgi:hypothetical protein
MRVVSRLSASVSGGRIVGRPAASIGDQVPILAGKTTTEGRAKTYRCENFATHEPIVGAESLESALASD